MAQRLPSPFLQFVDANGLPYSGGTLSFYSSGTSTPLNTYADNALSIANPNPIVLNSRGVPSVGIFLQNLAYKLVLSDVNNNQIWTADPVTADDFASFPVLIVGSGSPAGVVAGTAASAGSPNILPTFFWDFTNLLYYVCTTTGNAATAQWTALNPALSTPTPVILTPQGYLTPTTATPIVPSDVIAATAVYYTPYLGNMVPIYNGTNFVATQFTELTLTLNASAHSASTIYDVFVFSNSGVLTLVTGPAWSNSGAGTGARGTGAGTTQLARVQGNWLNAVSIAAAVNGLSTYALGANIATYLGSIFIDTNAGQVTCHRSYGQSRKWGVWNAYNRAPVYLKAGDSTANWTYPTNTIRPSNNSTSNSLITFSGLAEDTYDLAFLQRVQAVSVNNNASEFQIGIGFNSTTAFSGTTAGWTHSVATASANEHVALSSRFLQPPSLGINTITALENTIQTTGANNQAYYGTETYMLLSALWRA